MRAILLGSTWAAIGCAGPPDAALLAQALAPGVVATVALQTCDAISQGAVGDECRASVVRAHPELDDAAADAACGGISDPRWEGECWFGLAERRSARDHRHAALEACGRAGPFYDECLYHLWTAELSAVADAAPDAVGAVEPAREIVEFWSGLQTIGGDPTVQLWGDLWFFAWNEHRPADLAVCEKLELLDASRCKTHTKNFIVRAILGELMAPGAPTGLLDRTCRAQQIPASIRDGLFVAHPDLDAQEVEAARLSCDAAAGRPVRRYNPVFQARLPTGAPPIGSPPPDAPVAPPGNTPSPEGTP
jgi:hypothetical protein